MPSPPGQARRHARRVRRVVTALLAMAVILVAGLAALLWLRTPLIERELKAQVVPALSAALGRPIEVQTLRVRFFPLRGELDGVQVGGVAGGPALGRVRQVRLNLRFWPLVRSLGHTLRLRSLVLDGATLTWVRGPSGWDAGIAGAASRTPGERGELVIGGLVVHRGQVRWLAGDGRELGVLSNIEGRVLGVGSGRGLRGAFTAQLGSDQNNARGQFTARPGRAGWVLNGTASARSVALPALAPLVDRGMEGALTDGTASLSTSARIAVGRSTQLNGHLEVNGAIVRGRRFDARGDVSVSATPRASPSIAISGLHFQGAGVSLDGTVRWPGAGPIRFSLSGPLLNVNAYRPPQAAPRRSGAGPGARTTWPAADAVGQVSLSKVIDGHVELNHAVAHARLSRGVLTLSHASADLYGGRLTVPHAHLDLTQPGLPWRLRARLTRVDLGRATQAIANVQPLQGTLDAQLSLSGNVARWAQLRRTLAGHGSLRIRSGVWASADLEHALSAPLREAAQAAGHGRSGGQARRRTTRATSLRGVQGTFRVSRGALRFREPLRVESTFGDAALTGTVGLDARLDLAGVVLIEPEFVSKVVALRPAHSIAAPIAVTGSLDVPQIHIDTQRIVRSLVLGAPWNLLRHALDGLFGHH